MKTKPWDELSDIEKREAIALRLGWKVKINEGPLAPWQSPNSEWHEEPLGWPTNNGLAFEEVWLKLLETKGELCLCLLYDDVGKDILKSVANHDLDLTLFEPYQSDTWADVICHAAYELLEVPK